MSNNFNEQEKDGLYKAIFSRRDVRSHFTSEPIDDEILTRILTAAHHAPSVGFSQPWNFILIKDSKQGLHGKNEIDAFKKTKNFPKINNVRLTDLVLLKIETFKLDNLVWEQASDGNMFPHLYSSFDISNVCNEHDITLNEDGTHTLPSNY